MWACVLEEILNFYRASLIPMALSINMQVNTQNSANANEAQSTYPLALKNTSQYKQTYYFI